MSKKVAYVGIDMAIRHTGVCCMLNRLIFFEDIPKSNLSLKSNLDDYAAFSRYVTSQIAQHIPVGYKVVVGIDITYRSYRQRAQQQTKTALLIGITLGCLKGVYGDLLIVPVDPTKIRRHANLSPHATKDEVWAAYRLDNVDDRSEDCNDAYALCKYVKIYFEKED